MSSIQQIRDASKRPLPIEVAANANRSALVMQLSSELATSRELADALLERNADLEAELTTYKANAETAARLNHDTIAALQKEVHTLEGKVGTLERQVKRREKDLDYLHSSALCEVCEDLLENCLDDANSHRCAECQRLMEDCLCVNRCHYCKQIDCRSKECRRLAKEDHADEAYELAVGK